MCRGEARVRTEDAAWLGRCWREEHVHGEVMKILPGPRSQLRPHTAAELITLLVGPFSSVELV